MDQCNSGEFKVGKRKKGERNKIIIEEHFLFTSQDQQHFQLWKSIYPFVHVTFRNVSKFMFFWHWLFMWMCHGREHWIENAKHNPALWKVLCFSVYFATEYVDSRQHIFWGGVYQFRLVLKRMAAITIQSSKLLKWCTYMSKQHKLCLSGTVMPVFHVLWFHRSGILKAYPMQVEYSQVLHCAGYKIAWHLSSVLLKESLMFCPHVQLTNLFLSSLFFFFFQSLVKATTSLTFTGRLLKPTPWNKQIVRISVHHLSACISLTFP